MLEAGVLEQLELLRGSGEDALGVQVAGERGSARPVLGVDEVVDAHRVVQEREEEDHDVSAPSSGSASQSPFAPTVRQCTSPWTWEPMPVLRARTSARSGSSTSRAAGMAVIVTQDDALKRH